MLRSQQQGLVLFSHLMELNHSSAITAASRLFDKLVLWHFGQQMAFAGLMHGLSNRVSSFSLKINGLSFRKIEPNDLKHSKRVFCAEIFILCVYEIFFTFKFEM